MTSPALRPVSAFRPLAIALLAFTSCVDAPLAPDASTFLAPWVIAPSLALVGPTGEAAASQAQSDALNAAFDLVDHFRMVVRRAATSETVLDTIIAVTPGQDEYDLSVSVAVLNGGEQFSISLTALQGTTVLFTADPVTVVATATSATSSTPPAPISVTMRYSGPGTTATSVQLSPATLVLAPGASGSYTVEVQATDGSVISDVPLSWTTEPVGVVTVGEGQVTAVGEGAAEVLVATPTGLVARAWAYVVGGELAYAEAGVVKVRGPASGSATERSTAGGAGQPAWSPDGGRLYYAAGGRVHLADGGDLADGNWPSVSPDGTKLAVESGGRVYFTNEDGTAATEGPTGGTPVWVDGADVLVSGGSVERVRADGTGRTNLAGGDATLPALGPAGEVAYLADGGLYVVGRTEAVLEGATGRPTWSEDGQWLVVGTGGGLSVVPADGRGPSALLPGLTGATDPAFKPTGSLAQVLPVQVTGLDPDPPTPGQPVTLQGIGFDWIIPGNNVVHWPTPGGAFAGDPPIRVTETTLETVMPNSVVAGPIRVATRTSTDLFAFVPELAAIDVMLRTPFEAPVSGIEVAVRDEGGVEVLRRQTDTAGRALMTGLMPGTYEVEVLLPAGFRLDGDAVHTLTLGTETVLHEVVVVPLVETVTTVPEELEVEVGSSLDVTLVPVDFRGEVMDRVVSSTWLSVLPSVAAHGQDLTGTILGATPSAGPLQSVLAVELNGSVFEIPVSVTSYVEGTVTRDPDPAPSPPSSVTSSEGGPTTVDTEPSMGTVVNVLKEGVVVSTGTADGHGRYHAGGLFAGSYTASIDPTADRSPIPDLQNVVLDDHSPFAVADFLMSRAAVDHIVLTATPMEIDAIDGTTTVEAEAFDVDANLLGGRAGVFVSSDPSIATVSPDGVVTAVDNGSTVITVTVEAVTNTIIITVDQKADIITLLDDHDSKPLPDEIRAIVGEGGTLLWTAFDVNGYPVTHKTPIFTSTDIGVAMVDAGGVVSVLTVGTADVTANLDGATDVLTLHVLNVHVGDLVIIGPSDLLAVQTGLIGKVTGNLVIEATSLANLTGLESLLEIGGSIVLRLNSLLASLEGLGGIEWVMGDVIIEGNPLLVTPPLSQSALLTNVEGSLRVIDNDAIADLDGFGNLEFVGMDIEFVGNDALTNLDGLSKLRHLDGLLQLSDNPLLDSRNNLPNVLSIAGNLVVEAGARVFGMPMLTAVQGELRVGGSVALGNTVVQEIDLPALICTGQGVYIYENAALTTVGLPALDLVEPNCGSPSVLPVETPNTVLLDFLFRDDAPRAPQVGYGDLDRRARERIRDSRKRMQEAQDRRNVIRDQARTEARTHTLAARTESAGSREDTRQEEVAGAERRGRPGPARDVGPLPAAGSGINIEIWNNPALTGLDLSGLVEVDDVLDIWNNGLQNLALPILEYVGGIFCLSAMPSLVSFSAPMLMEVGWLEIANDPVLSSFQAPALHTAHAGVSLVSNGALGPFTLPQLQQLPNGDFYAWGNTGLTSVTLPVLAFAMDGTGFYNNAGLLSIEMATGSSLDLSDDGGEVSIFDNPDLQSVHIPGLVETFDGVSILRNDALVSVVIATTSSLDSEIFIRDNNVPHPWSVTIPGLAVAHWVTVENNTGLQSVSMASGGPAQAYSILFSNNVGLQSISLPNLTSIHGRHLTVQLSPDLQSLSAPMLVDIAWDLLLDGLGTAGTATTVALDALQKVGRYMYIQNSPGLESFALPALASVVSYGKVWNNAGLSSFTMPALTHMMNPPIPSPGRSGPSPVGPPASLAADLVIAANPVLTTFDVSALTEVGTLVVKNNAALGIFPAVGPLSVGSQVTVQDNPVLTSLAGLAGVTDLHTLYLDNNPTLSGSSGLTGLQALVRLYVINNGAVGTLALPALTHVWELISVDTNSGLTGISAPAMTLLGPGSGPSGAYGDLSVRSSPALTLVDFPVLATLDGRLEFSGNGIMHLDGLAALRSPVNSVIVQSNPALASVLGLAGIGTTSATPATSWFYVANNTVLDDCHVNTEVVAVIEARNPGGAFGSAPYVSNVPCGP